MDKRDESYQNFQLGLIITNKTRTSQFGARLKLNAKYHRQPKSLLNCLKIQRWHTVTSKNNFDWLKWESTNIMKNTFSREKITHCQKTVHFFLHLLMFPWVKDPRFWNCSRYILDWLHDVRKSLKKLNKLNKTCTIQGDHRGWHKIATLGIVNFSYKEGQLKTDYLII